MTSVTGKGGSNGAAEVASAVDKLVLATINAPYKRTISAAELVNCIEQAKLGEWPVHIAAFFTEVSPSLVFRFAGDHGISKSKLAQAYLVMKTETGERNPDVENELGPLVTSAR